VPKNMDELIAKLKITIAQKKLTSDEIAKAIGTLKELGHKTYDRDKFPALENTDLLDVEVGSTPVTLSEKAYRQCQSETSN
jgi:phage gp16-like protein